MKHLLLLTIFVLSTNAVAKSRRATIQDRLTKIENQLIQQSNNQVNSAELVMQIEALQQQIAELKGVIEEQNHQIDNLKDKQKLLYVDIDTRITDLEAKSTGQVTNPAFDQINESNSSIDSSITDDPASRVVVGNDYNTTNNQVITSQPVLSNYQDDYDIAFAHLRAGRYAESARGFEDFIQKYPSNELTDDAYYWLGESYYVKRQYPQALAAFQMLAETYPNSSKAQDSWLKIGYSYFEMEDMAKAEENLKKVIEKYPNSAISRLAKNRLLQINKDN